MARSLSQTPGAIRARRWRALAKEHKALGRFVIYEKLVQALVWNGEVADDEAMHTSGAERGVAKVLARYTQETHDRLT